MPCQDSRVQAQFFQPGADWFPRISKDPLIEFAHPGECFVANQPRLGSSNWPAIQSWDAVFPVFLLSFLLSLHARRVESGGLRDRDLFDIQRVAHLTDS